MENKGIDKAAMEYAERIATSGQFTTSECVQMAKDDFIAGAQSRQSEIDELIEALEEATRWIPISERLPEVDKKSGISKEVIAYCPSVYKVLHYCKNSYYPNGAWFCASEELQSYPTHWRPIDTPKAIQLLE